MKIIKTAGVIIFFSSFLLFSSVFAHSGDKDRHNGHVCRTNCAEYDYTYGEYHIHNRDGSITIPKCSVNSYYKPGIQRCKCEYGYVAKGEDSCMDFAKVRQYIYSKNEYGRNLERMIEEDREKMVEIPIDSTERSSIRSHLEYLKILKDRQDRRIAKQLKNISRTVQPVTYITKQQKEPRIPDFEELEKVSQENKYIAKDKKDEEPDKEKEKKTKKQKSEKTKKEEPKKTKQKEVKEEINCRAGYSLSLDEKRCVKIPKNAHAVNSPTDVWLCNEGYVESGYKCVKDKPKKSKEKQKKEGANKDKVSKPIKEQTKKQKTKKEDQEKEQKSKNKPERSIVVKILESIGRFFGF